jgi:carbamate kinase
MLIVVALGGNAVSLPGKEGNIADQFNATRAACGPLADLIQAGHQLVITHGNGPQVGNVMRRVELAAQHHVYPLPLDIAVADTQAGMGYMICQCLMNEMARRGKPIVATTIITTVQVDPSDPAFSNPDKPVGPFMSEQVARRHVEVDHWQIRPDPGGRGFRRVVPSPQPRHIVELPLLRTLVGSNHLIVAAGGGGVPVRRNADNSYAGVEAVIDKDRTSAILAIELDADLLAILTAVDQVQTDYNQPTAKSIAHMTTSQARQLMQQDQFAPGSMLPKVEAAVTFAERTQKPHAQALITSVERFAEGFAGTTGTRIVRE